MGFQGSLWNLPEEPAEDSQQGFSGPSTARFLTAKAVVRHMVRQGSGAMTGATVNLPCGSLVDKPGMPNRRGSRKERGMAKTELKSFGKPDEVRQFPKG